MNREQWLQKRDEGIGVGTRARLHAIEKLHKVEASTVGIATDVDTEMIRIPTFDWEFAHNQIALVIATT